MRLIALIPVRNESWCLRYTLPAALTWCDHAVILCHACTDGTHEIVDRFARQGRVTWFIEPDPTWNEMEHRQRLLDTARGVGATHFTCIDADEVLSANCRKPIRSLAARLPKGHTISTPLHNLWRSLDRARCDSSPYGGNWALICCRDSPDLHWPVDAAYPHHARYPAGANPTPLPFPNDGKRDRGGLMHLQHASWRRVTAKVAHYQAYEAVRWPGRSRETIRAMYSAALREDGARFLDVPAEWWDYGLDRDLVRLSEPPWQEKELQDLIETHGAGFFGGLDLDLDRP